MSEKHKFAKSYICREDIVQHLAVTILGRGVLTAPVHNWRESLGAALIQASLYHPRYELSLSQTSWQRDLT